MKISSTNSQILFNGRYRVLLTEKEFDKFEKNIVPVLDDIHKGNVNYFYGKTPFESDFAEALAEYARKNNANLDWASENVKRYGIPMSNSNSSILWVTTGVKDCVKLAQFEDKRERIFYVNQLVANIKLLIKNISLPPDIITLKTIDNALKNESKAFYKFSKDYPFIKLNKAEDIIIESTDTFHKLFED